MSATPVMALIISIVIAEGVYPLAYEIKAMMRAMGPAPITGINEAIKVIKKTIKKSATPSRLALTAIIVACTTPVTTFEKKTSFAELFKTIIKRLAIAGEK